MKRDQYLVHKAVALAVAAALGGYAIPASSADAIPTYTYCVTYPNDPGCPGYVPPAPKAAAPTPAAAAAPEQPKEKTVVVAEPGPPPNKAGECYTKVMLPAEWRNEPTQQMVRAAGERVEYSEPVYQDAEERVLVKPASKKVTVVPAEYGQVEEKVLVREAYRREIEIPALYNTYFDKVMEKPARDVWKPGRGTVEKIDPTTGEILCLVHEDATYKTVERKELCRAASKRYEDVPAEYATVKKTVLKKPESVQGGRNSGRVPDHQGAQAGEGARAGEGAGCRPVRHRQQAGDGQARACRVDAGAVRRERDGCQDQGGDGSAERERRLAPAADNSRRWQGRS